MSSDSEDPYGSDSGSSNSEEKASVKEDSEEDEERCIFDNTNSESMSEDGERNMFNDAKQKRTTTMT